MRTLSRPIPLFALAGLALGGCNEDAPFLPADPASDATADAGTGGDATADVSVDIGLDGAAPDSTEPDTTTPDGSGSDTTTDGDAPDNLTDETRAALLASVRAYCEAAVPCVTQGEDVEPYLMSVETCITGLLSTLDFDELTEECAIASAAYGDCSAENGDCVSELNEVGEEYFLFYADEYGVCSESYDAATSACGTYDDD